MDRILPGRAALAALACAALLSSCGGGDNPMPPASADDRYAMQVLVSDSGTSPYHDTHLINGWGVAFNPQGYVWVANAETDTSTLYDGNGVPQSLVVTVPAGSSGEAHPTGIVYNGTADFVVAQGAASGAAPFIFATEGGTLAAWSPNVNSTVALTVADNGAAGASYKGLALLNANGANRLYAADFHNGRVDVFDAAFQPVALAAGAFTDPSLPAGYAPFGIQAVSGNLVVTYAMQDDQAEDEVPGAGLGAVDLFDANGTLLKHLVSPGGVLNAPWGVALAPADFGKFGGALLVANFGDGRINAFDASSGALLGTLNGSDGMPLAIEGLWGIAFGNGLNNQPTHTLFFAAGPGDEAHGAYGRIDPP